MSLKYPSETEMQGQLLSSNQKLFKSYRTKIRWRKEDILWTLEEEFLFFEMHLHLGNKWTKYDCFFHNKTPKDLKNHFHACIIKTIRRIVKNKYDYELKDIIRSFYCFNYLLLLFKKDNQSLSPKISYLNSASSSKTKFNTKNCVTNNQLSLSMIENYKNSFYNTLLQIKPNMLNIFKDIGYNDNNIISVKPELMRWFFYINIKSRLLKQSMKVIEEGSINDIESLGALCNFVNDNFHLESISDSLLNE